jgi:thiamine-phosphate pyrophosphorylase
MMTATVTGRRAPLPPLLLLTDRSQVPAHRTLTEVVADCVDAGLRAVVVRERDLEDRERADLVHDLGRLLTPVGGRLLVGAPELGLPDGLHLRSTDPPPRTHAGVLGRSCHDAEELARAVGEGCDYVTLSPVAQSDSKPGHGPPLGADGLESLARHGRGGGPGSLARHGRRGKANGDAPKFPAVYALGGVTPDNAREWVDAGADGVAVMGAVMRAPDPAAVVARLLRALAPDSRVTSQPFRSGTHDTRLQRGAP